MAQIKTTVQELAPIGGQDNSGYGIGRIGGTPQAVTVYPKGDTILVTNASKIIWAHLMCNGTPCVSVISGGANSGTAIIDTTGSVNGTGFVEGIIIYR